MPITSSVVHDPWKSGSPHGVRAGVYVDDFVWANTDITATAVRAAVESRARLIIGDSLLPSVVLLGRRLHQRGALHARAVETHDLIEGCQPQRLFRHGPRFGQNLGIL